MIGSNPSHAAPPPRSVLEVLRRADWMTAARARAYCAILFWISAAVALVWIGLSQGGLDPTGKPLGTDFTDFWTASRLALGGTPALAYDVGAHHAQQTALFGHDVGYTPF